mgnify:CR=1 FL=1
MNSESFRTEVRDLLQRHRHAAQNKGEVSQAGLCIPLRVSSAASWAVLADLIQRLAASATLAAAHDAGLLRFELRIDNAMAAAVLPVGNAASSERNCCEPCLRGETCSCQTNSRPAAASMVTPLLRGVITERDIKALPDGCLLVGIAPRAVLTPLARDALRQRGIAFHPKKET